MLKDSNEVVKYLYSKLTEKQKDQLESDEYDWWENPRLEFVVKD